MTQKSILSIYVFLAFLGLTSTAAAAPALKTVDQVDLVRYQGLWYEVASIPASFQKKCVGNVTAEYKILPSGLVEVINSCELASGEKNIAEGRAKVTNPEQNSKLKVTFVKLVKWIFAFGGDYWIIDLDENYNYVVVGHPERTFGWILSRTPTLPDETLRGIQSRLEEKGYNSCDFMTTPQVGGFDQKVSLCKVL